MVWTSSSHVRNADQAAARISNICEVEVMDKISSLSEMSKPSESTPPDKWVAKPIVSKCGVCGNPADNVKHYGAVACYSCRWDSTMVRKYNM